MSWTREDLDALREGWDFEAKKAGGRDSRGTLPDDFWPSYSALANTHGGKIVLGVKERHDGSFEIHGIAEPDKLERDLWNQLANPQKVSTNLLSREDVHRETIDGAAILVIDVPRARRQDRPVYVNGDLWRGTYLRVHEGDRHADRERIRRMIADADRDSRDEGVLDGSTLADLDRESLRAYRVMFTNRRPDHPWLPLDEETFLERLGAMGRNPEDASLGVTTAGLLMFGRYETIRQAFPCYFLDYQERMIETGAIEWTDRIFPDGTWTGNLLEFYRRVIVKLTLDLKVPFQLDADMRRRDDTHVHEAVREALINTLIHADYEGRATILVVKSPNGFELRNPGTLRLPIEQIRTGGQSDCRNRTLQRMFLMIGFGEQAGSGFSRILRAWQEQHWQVPSLQDNVELDTTTLRLSMTSFLPQDTLDELRARFPSFSRLDEVARLAVAAAAMEGKITNRRMQHLSTRHPRDLTKMFQDLTTRGLLVAHGERSGTWYTVAGGDESFDQSSGQSSSSFDQSSPSFDQSSPSFDQSSPSFDQSSPSFDQTSNQRVRWVAGRPWASRKAVREAILDFCRHQFRSTSEIATSLNRAHGTIVRNYLPELVREGLLELRDPKAPRHPSQAYRTLTPRP